MEESRERNKQYFYGLENPNYEKRTTTKLKLPDGSYTNDLSKILQEQMHFYKTLHTSGKHRSSILNDAHWICKENIIHLENDDNLLCEGKVMREECLKALIKFKNEKSSGTDGLQAEFYKHFWKELHADMLHSFNYALYYWETINLPKTRNHNAHPEIKQSYLCTRQPQANITSQY